MSDDGPEINVNVENYPPSAAEGVMATVTYGPVGPMQVHLKVSLSEDEQSLDASVILSNLVENDEIAEGLTNAIEMLTMIRDSLPDTDKEQ